MVKIDKDEVTDEERGEAVVLRKEKEQRRHQVSGHRADQTICAADALVRKTEL